MSLNMMDNMSYMQTKNVSEYRMLDLGLKFINLFSNRIHWYFAKKIYQEYSNRDVERYDCSIDPFKVHFVSPHEIVEVTRRPVPFSTERWNLLGSVSNGDWDKKTEFIFSSDFEKREWFTTVFSDVRFDECLFYRTMVERYHEGKDWFETDYVDAVLDEIDKGNAVWHGCTDIEDVISRCEYIDNLYKRIKKEGYKTQQEIGVDFKTAMINEIIVDIGRNGRLLFVDGRHRLAIAKLLDLDKIPVTVGVRHLDWVKSR